MTEQVSPLAPERLPDFPDIAGISLQTTGTGVKYRGRDDLLLVRLAPGTVAAGVFTRSTAAGAPVVWCRDCLKQQFARGLVVNAGNANVFTGVQGKDDVNAMASSVASIADCDPADVFVASTGVIGEPLPMDKIQAGLNAFGSTMADNDWRAAAHAILTTDTFAKGATRTVSVGGKAVTINGFAKGSGMIEPDMATMLAFVFTDACVDKNLLQQLLVEANEVSFNAITVDSDTSTSDSVILFATGQAGNPQLLNNTSTEISVFRQALFEVMQDLALQVVRDGEGASKLIEIRVAGAGDEDEARLVGKTIANSPLVKTAIAGEDANWGRIVMAVGKSGVAFSEQALSIGFGGIPITESGGRADSYDEELVTRHLQGKEILIDVDLGKGAATASVWTCDLTHGYISINADYRS